MSFSGVARAQSVSMVTLRCAVQALGGEPVHVCIISGSSQGEGLCLTPMCKQWGMRMLSWAFPLSVTECLYGLVAWIGVVTQLRFACPMNFDYIIIIYLPRQTLIT